MINEVLYRDTLNYAPVDAVKGIDLLMKKVVLGDDIAPQGYKLRPMCKFCSYFEAKENHLGQCQKGACETYSELWAQSCEDYYPR